ncbi:allophanate hydrolase subunit 1 [Vibrio sp. EA2]|uniref:5-oxoprolinase subunit B family protein n=1 Tax=Vibrio sp. EA2 TaxID=3079860 RepID=UPI002948C789|nr:allophanate hydrolase subunit 1 [Vibrio sp. EA2]MDV6250175.1 allophanate hydrolase subunit 1 [Vibrio sp. EA2]
MQQKMFRISAVSECSILIKFEDSVLEDYIGELSRQIREQLASVTMNVVPSYRTILIDYLPFRVDENALIETVNRIIRQFDPKEYDRRQPNDISIPVYYSEETALDLGRFNDGGLSLQDVIDLHTQTHYSVSAIGFAPGFAFLSDVCNKLIMPRLTTPRTLVPAGSVGIADSKTAVYPSESPGGWNIIGRSPIALFSDTPPFIPFDVGDRVTFFAINKQEFIELGGIL